MSELTAETIVDASYPEDIRISPDGGRVAYTVETVSRREEHQASAIWVARTDGVTPPIRLTAGVANDCSPRWSPAGDAIYFLSDRVKREKHQLYRIALDGGEAEALTDWEPGVAAPAPLADGKSVAFLAVDPDSEEKKKCKKERDDAEVYGQEWPLQRLRILDLASREVTTIEALGGRHVVDVAPAPVDARLAVVVADTPELDMVLSKPEIFVVNLADGSASSVSHPAADVWRLAWGPGGKELLYIGFIEPGMRGAPVVFAVDTAGGEPRRISPEIEACPDDIAAGRDGTPYVLMLERLDSWIGRLDVASGHLERLHDLPGNAWSLDVSADGASLAVGRSARDDFASVWAGPVDGRLVKLTDLTPELAEIAWGAQEPIAWPAPDGMEIDGLLILPAGATWADGPFPLVTLVHGGPYGRHADELQLGGGTWGQWLALAGYAVLLPNPRGGSGRGVDFADRVAGRVGKEDWSDIEAGIDRLVAERVADPERLGIGGWSQGGYMTAWAVGQTRRFKVGIMGAGISDWGMMTATGDLPTFETVLGGSAPWDGVGPHRADALSPISFAASVTTPVLILHGAEDERVPVSQGRFFALALREHGVPNELVVYPREPHGIRERNHQLDLLRRVRSWVERWLGPGWSPGH